MCLRVFLIGNNKACYAFFAVIFFVVTYVNPSCSDLGACKLSFFLDYQKYFRILSLLKDVFSRS